MASLEETYQPAWKRKNLEKELEEISAIEATAIAIRQGAAEVRTLAKREVHRSFEKIQVLLRIRV